MISPEKKRTLWIEVRLHSAFRRSSYRYLFTRMKSGFLGRKGHAECCSEMWGEPVSKCVGVKLVPKLAERELGVREQAPRYTSHRAMYHFSFIPSQQTLNNHLKPLEQQHPRWPITSKWSPVCAPYHLSAPTPVRLLIMSDLDSLLVELVWSFSRRETTTSSSYSRGEEGDPVWGQHRQETTKVRVTSCLSIYKL